MGKTSRQNNVIISVSTRKNSGSSRVADCINTLYQQLYPEHHSTVVDLHDYKIPLWTEDFWREDYVPDEDWLSIVEVLTLADGFIFVVPEWDGMAPPVFKSFFNLVNKTEFFHKPCFLVGVSSGEGGVYPLAELRLSSFKNTRLCYIPEQLIVRHVSREDSFAFNDVTLERATYGLQIYAAYMMAFEQIREAPIVLQGKINFGV